jgi:hypothetical protein
MNAGAAPTISDALPARVRATPWTTKSWYKPLHTEEQESKHVMPRQREAAARVREGHEKCCRGSDTKSGEGNGIEYVRRVFDDDEIDSPDHGHREQEKIRQPERLVSGRIADGRSRGN